ncbi:MAG TPA: fibro-slime domain-containing protein [Chitinispirillaceae bacterium]|nr:fibro-slime domain-containing protein [Chitinispirillaceae bacterium]
MNRLTTGFCVLLAVIFFFSAANSQELPQTTWVKVTYYDFHSDRTNPEFEAPHTTAVRKGMVGSTLDADHKPVEGSSPYLNYYIKKWFRPFKPGDKTVPLYSPRAAYKSTTVEDVANFDEFNSDVKYLGQQSELHDTSFINFVIYDSLRFDLQANGMYQFRDDDFFPLDNRGFGNEWNYHCQNSSTVGDHNFSFTMELNWEFVMKPGLVFHFNGDDDVWVFINNKLQLDLGGIHKSTTDSIILDEIEELKVGKTYKLDVFYAERHSKESHLWITSNIFAPPSNLYIYGKSGVPNTTDNQPLGSSDSITAGVPFPLFGHIIDSLEQWKQEYDSLITWEISSTQNGSLSATKGSATVFTANTPNSEVMVTARFTNPTTGSKSEKSIVFFVRSKPAQKNYIIKLYKQPGDITILNPLGSSDSAGYKEPYTVYGHVFDKEGNWLVDYDSQLFWNISPEKIGSLSNSKGEQTTFTANTGNSQVLLTARLINPDDKVDTISCSVTLFIKSEPPPKQYIVRLYSDGNKLSSVLSENDTIEIDVSDTIYGHVFDTSGLRFAEFDKKLVWTAGPENAGKIQPATDSFTVFTALKFNSYVTIQATFTDPDHPDNKSSSKVTLHIRKAPVPYIIRLYSEPGDPSKLTALGETVTVTAGKPFNVYGHIFDTNEVWMFNFDQHIKWQLNPGDPATIDPLQGNTTTFQSTKTGTFTLSADFVDTTSKRPPSHKTLNIIVIPDKPCSLQIIKDTLKLTNPQPFDTLRFGENDKPAQIYAIIKDQYGNFIGLAEKANWQSKDSDVASISPTYGFTTIVASEKKSANHETYIIVSQNGLIPDTIHVTSAPKRMTVILPNPFTPGKDDINRRLPQNIIDFYRNILTDIENPSVTLVAIQTDVPLVPLNSSDSLNPKTSYGKVTVYDAVGNVIRRDLKLLRANVNSIYSYGITWDARNDNKRFVGTGGYLFMINGKLANGAAFKHSVKVGIKR